MLDEITEVVKRRGLNAILVGSAARKQYSDYNDIDIVLVSDESIRIEPIKEDLDNVVDKPIHIHTFSLSELVARFQSGDPYVLTMFQDPIFLNIEERIKRKIHDSYPDSLPETSEVYTRQLMIASATNAYICMANALIYNGYMTLYKNGQFPPPPNELPNILNKYDQEAAEQVKKATEFKNKLKSRNTSREIILKDMSSRLDLFERMLGKI